MKLCTLRLWTALLLPSGQLIAKFFGGGELEKHHSLPEKQRERRVSIM